MLEFAVSSASLVSLALILFLAYLAALDTVTSA